MEGTTGILVFLTLARDAEKTMSGLRGQITQFNRASQAALQGLGCAFPEDIALEGTQEAIGHVLDACRAALTECFPEEASAEVLDVILDSIDQSLRASLIK